MQMPAFIPFPVRFRLHAGVPDGTDKLNKLGLVPFSDALEEVDMELPAFGGARSIAGQWRSVQAAALA